MEEIHGVITEERTPRFTLGTLGYGTIALATALFAYCIWTGAYFAGAGVLLAELLLVVWIHQGHTAAVIIRNLVVFGFLVGLTYYVLIAQPEFFYIFDTKILPLLQG